MCVSCVPTSCVHIWFVSCPCFMSLWVKYVPAVFVWLCVNYPVYLVPVFWVWFRLVYSLLPSVSCLSVLPWCLIKDYYLSLYPRQRVPVPPSCVHRDRRPDLNRKRRPFTPLCFPFLKVFYLVPEFCLFVPRHGSRRSLFPPLAHCKSAWEFGGIAASAASPLAASPHARQSREISGCLVPGLPLPQARRSREITPPARLWLNARRPASDSMPAGSPLTQARRIAADSSPPDWRWLMPAGHRYP